MNIKDFEFLFPKEKKDIPLWCILTGCSIFVTASLLQYIGVPGQFYTLTDTGVLVVYFIIFAPLWTIMLNTFRNWHNYTIRIRTEYEAYQNLLMMKKVSCENF